jgi:hypothetical protein
MGDGEMPHEKIQDESGVEAHVSWSNERYVQVATLSANPKEFVEWCRNLVSEWDEKAELHERLGMFWTPNRYEINQLIRILRRARDMAFGKDE